MAGHPVAAPGYWCGSGVGRLLLLPAELIGERSRSSLRFVVVVVVVKLRRFVLALVRRCFVSFVRSVLASPLAFTRVRSIERTVDANRRRPPPHHPTGGTAPPPVRPTQCDRPGAKQARLPPLTLDRMDRDPAFATRNASDCDPFCRKLAELSALRLGRALLAPLPIARWLAVPASVPGELGARDSRPRHGSSQTPTAAPRSLAPVNRGGLPESSESGGRSQPHPLPRVGFFPPMNKISKSNDPAHLWAEIR